MKVNPLLFLWAFPALLLTSCTDKCEETRTVKRFVPITLTLRQVREGVRVEEARTLQKPGKIYTKDGYLFINEVKEGIHLIDNRNPESPRQIAFLRIPGNGDMAVRNNILYADSYMDLVAFDISDPAQPREVSRVESVFTNGQFEGGSWVVNTQNVSLSDQRVEYVTETVKTDCDAVGQWSSCPNCVFFDGFANAGSLSSPAPNTNGTSGSMARFALYDNFLYTVSQSDLQLFDIQNAAKPAARNRINLGWGIETIFPYKDKLFIGSQTGMHIYDNANPANPTRLSTFEHARVCDPVVVNDNIAYVTLRNGTQCGGFTNQLDVIDISSLTNPRLLKSYPMQNPHGLGVDFPNLFICEGANGLKTFNAQSATDIKQLEHLTDMNAYDVIPLQKTLLMIGRDGLYQFDYTNPSQLRQLSKIAVKRPY
ncbi:LVIVD repeat-containing protein [Spirosoma oryzicola]|uniref:LVIVD repeat-containing protein n=1 Tax=Spirosoma oryzicola TaxID=2898794 RepID=UPI001E5A6B04|nr:hypothetical protein [Spirosoma oryzicola]UHG91287.1 hypothetical protein LQ777_24035 [Spirosoma oryzicola]